MSVSCYHAAHHDAKEEQLEIILILIAGLFFLLLFVLSIYLLVLAILGGGLLLMFASLGAFAEGEISNGLFMLLVGLVMTLIGGGAMCAIGGETRLIRRR